MIPTTDQAMVSSHPQTIFSVKKFVVLIIPSITVR